MTEHPLFENANERMALVMNSPNEFAFTIKRKTKGRRSIWLTAAEVNDIINRIIVVLGPTGPTGPSGPAGHIAAHEAPNEHHEAPPTAPKPDEDD